MFRKRHPPAGATPGTLMIDSHAPPAAIHVMKYRPGHLEEHDVADAAQLRGLLDPDSVCWIDVQGLGNEGVLRSLADTFAIHRLALEDVVNVPQRPKVEPYDQHVLCITRMATQPEPHTCDFEQVSLFVGRNYVLTFQERCGDVFDPVRSRLRHGGPTMRGSGPSYLAYALLDAVIDGYYPIMEELGEHLDALEDRLVVAPRPAILQEIHHVRRELLLIRRAVWPQRDALNTLIREENAFFTNMVRVHLRDCYDHCVQIMDVIETYRELAGSLMDVYLSSIGNRQNEVMKVLTIMASIFIPLTFMAGVYGMNFEDMPELHTKWGYPLLLVAMATVAAAMVFYFRRKGWLGSPPTDEDTEEAGRPERKA